MKRRRAKEMKSDHPGGYDDIVSFMEKQGIYIPDARGRTHKASDIVVQLPSGEAASAIHRALLSRGWFVPGDPEWMIPCKEWEERRKQG